MNALNRGSEGCGVTKFWDTVNLEYPVRLVPETGASSETIGREYRDSAQVLNEQRKDTTVRGISENAIENHKNSQITRNLNRSQTNLDYGSKPLTVSQRFCRASPSENNLYIVHGENKKLNSYPFRLDSHGTTEMKRSYRVPERHAQLTHGKAQWKHPYPLEHLLSPDALCDSTSIPINSNSFLKHLDPYVSSTHLDHPPFTEEQLNARSTTKDIVTYYTYADVPRVRRPRPYTGEWWWPKSAQVARPVTDREKFKYDCREMRVPNQLQWTPSSFRTETAINFMSPTARPESKIKFNDFQVKAHFNRTAPKLRPEDVEKESVTRSYTTESRDMNSGRPLAAVIDQHVEINRYFNR